MKKIKVFIASSEELRLERLEFVDMIQYLNRIIKPHDLEIDPIKWEYLDASMGPIHKQEEYQKELKTCEMCLVLYWTQFGDYTKSELDVAYTELCAGRNPKKLYVYFKDSEEITPELKTFKDSFPTNYGHFYCRFENVDTLKINFLLQFMDYQNKKIGTLIKVRNSQVEVDGHPFVALQNVPFAGNNPEYQELLRQIELTQSRVLRYPDDMELRQELHNLQERRETMENNLLDTAKLITRMSTTVTTARIAEAIRLFEAGDNKGANAVLNFEEISKDADSNVVRLHAVREIEKEILRAIEQNIEEYRLKVRTLCNMMEAGWVADVIKVYDKAVSVARGNISSEKLAELIREYADFLGENKQYHLVGNLYEESMSLYKHLSEENPEKYEREVAVTLNNLACLHYEIHRYDIAEEEFKEVLEIYRRLSITNSELFEGDVAMTLYNLANLHYSILCYDKAEKEYKEALSMYYRLCVKYPGTFENDMAKALSNFANLHHNILCYDLAEKEYKKALEIFYLLYVRNPERFERYVAGVLNNLANLHHGIMKITVMIRRKRNTAKYWRYTVG